MTSLFLSSVLLLSCQDLYLDACVLTSLHACALNVILKITVTSDFMVVIRTRLEKGKVEKR